MSALLPVSLDLARLGVALVGTGPRAERRLGLLDEAGATRLTVFSPAPSPALSAGAGERLQRRLPKAADMKGVNVVFVAGLDAAQAESVAALASETGALVNVEYVTESCDFHSAAVVRRGDLVVGIATGGRCPILARALKQWLERALPRDFAATVAALTGLRLLSRRTGAGNAPLETAALSALARLDAQVLPERRDRAA